MQVKPKENFYFLIAFILSLLLCFSFLIILNLPLEIQGKEFTIYSQENLREIAFRLEKEKIIPFPSLFIILSKYFNKEKDFQPGVYTFDKNYSLKKLIFFLTEKNHSIFLVKEGETLKEIEENLKNKGFIKGDIVNYQLKDFFGPNNCLKENFLEASENNLEGFLFPDSYHLVPNKEEKEVLKIMIDNFCQRIFHKELINEISIFQKNFSQFYSFKQPSFYDILKMASILEKEVKTEKDKRMVADILWRRLSINMPLQVDASICYALFSNFKDCSLAIDDFKIESLFNTYLFKGLPPTPISNPGIESIKSAISPIPNNYWFYLTTKNGKTIYSNSYQEHLKNKKMYLK